MPTTRAVLGVLGLVSLCAAGAGEVRAAEPAGPASRPTAAVLRIAGSSTMCPMVKAIAERYRAAHPEVQIDVECGGSDRGIKGVREKSVDIGMVARALKAEEKDLVGFPMARDGVSLIVHKSNPLAGLSSSQVADIFSGKTGSWRALGGGDARITVILREKDRPVTELFEKHFKLKELKGKVVPGDNPVTVDAVAADPGAIGYVSAGEAERKVNAGFAIRLVPLDGVLPTSRNVITGNYALTRPLSLITRELPLGHAKNFINYCLSSKVVDLIEKYDLVPYED